MKKATLRIYELVGKWTWDVETKECFFAGRLFTNHKSARAAATRFIRKLGLTNLYDFGDSWK